jgi:hypothetical protein
MRKFTAITFMLALVSLFSVAQTMSNKKKADIKETEVPVVIRTAFDREFKDMSGSGSWSIYYSTTRRDGKTIATPIWYTFSGTNAGQKTEIRFLPDGKLKSARGIARKEHQDNGQTQDEKPSTRR